VREWFVVAFAAQTLRIAAPIAMAALGGAISERAGVVALALEGMLLAGALAAELAAHATGSPWLGVASAAAGGAVLAALYGLAVIRFRADQIVSGVAVNILALGGTTYFIQLFYGSASNAPGIESMPSWIMVLLTVVAVGLVWLALRFTPFGLRVRAVGEHPDAAASLGVPVARVRAAAVLASGALAGLGGAWLALENHGFVSNMSSGRGYLALAAVIMGKWRPVPTALACLFFGAAQAAQIQLKTAGLAIPDTLADLLPYILTIVALAGFIGRSRSPAALGRPYLAD
jgi:simple sugar transport system permease protein